MRGTGMGPQFQRFSVASPLPACSQTAGQDQRGKGREGLGGWVGIQDAIWGAAGGGGKGEDRATGIGSFSFQRKLGFPDPPGKHHSCAQLTPGWRRCSAALCCLLSSTGNPPAAKKQPKLTSPTRLCTREHKCHRLGPEPSFLLGKRHNFSMACPFLASPGLHPVLLLAPEGRDPQSDGTKPWLWEGDPAPGCNPWEHRDQCLPCCCQSLAPHSLSHKSILFFQGRQHCWECFHSWLLPAPGPRWFPSPYGFQALPENLTPRIP